jgi:hypothetical protein
MTVELEDAGRNVGVVPWTVRRRLIIVVSAFCMLTVAYCLWHRLDSKVAEAAVTMAFTTLMGIVGSYVFGAAWEDKGKRNG